MSALARSLMGRLHIAQEDPREDQRCADEALRGEVLVQKHDAENGRHERVQRAEHAGAVRGRPRLRDGLERKAEAAAHDREGADTFSCTLSFILSYFGNASVKYFVTLEIRNPPTSERNITAKRYTIATFGLIQKAAIMATIKLIGDLVIIRRII